MNFKAVLFDLDGVLVNSEVLQQSLSEQFIKEFNYDVPATRFHLLIGAHSSHNPWPRVVDGYDLKGETIDQFINRLRTYKQGHLKNIDYNDWLFKDVANFLAYLHQSGYKIACASSSNMSYILNILEQCHLLHYFDLIVTGDDFTKSKPDPEIYLYCASKFNLEPSSCLVIEDSSYGIQAGKSAGMVVAARKDYSFNLDQSLADYHFDDLGTLISKLV